MATPQAKKTVPEKQSANKINEEIEKLCLSPRFSAALMRSGFVKEELYAKELDDFWEKDIPKDIQRLRYDHFEQRRREKLKTVFSEKESLERSFNTSGPLSPTRFFRSIESPSPIHGRPATSPLSGGSSLFGGSESSFGDTLKMKEKEARRLEKIQKRTKAEIDMLISAERRAQEITQKQEQKIMLQRQREEKLKKEVEARQKEANEQRKMREMKRLADMEEEERARKKLAEEMSRKEAERAAEEQRRHMRLREMAEEKERMRQEKSQQLQQKRDELMLERQMEALKVQEDMARKEEQLREKRMRDQMEREHKILEQREKVETRIQAALEYSAYRQAKKKEDFDKKQKQMTDRKLQLSASMGQLLQEKLSQKELKERKRQQALMTAKEKEKHKQDTFLDQMTREQQILMERAQQKAFERMVKEEQHRLRQQDKKENVERMRRLDELRKAEFQSKLHQLEERTNEMLAMRRREVEFTRVQHSEALKTKHDLMSSIERIKKMTDLEKASELMDALANGTPIDEKLRSSRKKKKSLDLSASTPELPTVASAKKANATAPSPVRTLPSGYWE